MAQPADTTRMSSKGQVVLPISIRNARHWTPGTEFEVHALPEGVLLTPIEREEQTRIEDVAGCLKPRRTVSQADMDAAIATEVRKRHARGRY